jgi:hypothetical protein
VDGAKNKFSLAGLRTRKRNPGLLGLVRSPVTFKQTLAASLPSLQLDFLLAMIANELLQRIKMNFLTVVLLFLCLSKIVSYKDLRHNEPMTKVYALYFPQFHNDPVNSQLWGEGFSDWNNLNRSQKINRKGQPLLTPHPSIGYYDLTSYHIRKVHRELAVEHEVDGFIYHHYWFYQDEVTPVLSTPMEKMLLDGEPDMPFAFNWAFDSWVANWHGKSIGKLGTSGKLYEQRCPVTNHTKVAEHYLFLRKFFFHRNYIRVNGVPLFFVLSSIAKAGSCYILIEMLKQLAIFDGFPKPGLYIQVVSNENHMGKHELYSRKTYLPKSPKFTKEFFYPFIGIPHAQMKMPERCYYNDYRLSNYTQPQYPSTMFLFDNTPRREHSKASIWDRNFTTVYDPIKSWELDLVTMMMYERCCQFPYIRKKGGQFIVLNAWNEWGEGMSIEPSEQYGLQPLQTIKKAKSMVSKMNCRWEDYQQYLRETMAYLKPNDTATVKKRRVA